MILGFITVYVALQLAVGVFVARRVKTDEDYLVAGRSLGPALTTATMFATWFGAETCVGAAGRAYEHGLFGISADPFGYGLCLILFGLVLARPLHRAGATTIADLFSARFGTGIARAVALLMIPGSVLWAAAQIRAFGTVVASATDLVGVDEALLLAAGVVILYTSLGGLLADAYTDLLQGGVLLAALAALAIAVFATPEARILLADSVLRPPDGPPPSWMVRIDAFAVPILGSLFAQELAARAAAARSAGLARNAALGAGGLYLVAGSIPVLLGLVARAQLPGLELPEGAVAVLAERYLGPLGQGILVGALVSAILSTIDSALLAASGLLTQNLLPVVLKNPERHRLRAARIGVVGLGALAFLLARSADTVHGLVEEASAFGSAGFVVAGLWMLAGGRGGPLAAGLSLAGGAIGYVVSAHGLELEAAFLGSLACAALGFGLGLAIEVLSPPSPC